MTESNRPGPILSESAYKTAKALTQLWIPLFASLYFGFSLFLDLPATEWVLGGLAFFALFFGVALKQSSENYYNSPFGHDGEMVMIVDGGGVRTFSLEVNGDPDELAFKDVITFKVRKTAVPEPPLD